VEGLKEFFDSSVLIAAFGADMQTMGQAFNA
jgi:hypothetical protein